MKELDDGIRDVHYIISRLRRQKQQFQKDTSKINYKDWLIYESWLIGHGRKRGTVLKQFGAFKRILRMNPTSNLKGLTNHEIIELNSKIVQSVYATTTKINTQLFLRQYLKLFASTEKQKKEIETIIKILPEPTEHNPDKDEQHGIISYTDFRKILKHMRTNELQMMVKVLFSTGMRITELYNIVPRKLKFVPKKFIFLTLPPSIFGYRGVWIYTRGKRTKYKEEGRYLYYMSFFVNEFKQYAARYPNNVYIFNMSYSYFLHLLHVAVEKENLPYVVHPHLFRHTFATKLFKKFSDQTVKKILNWAKDSDMPAKYSHIKKADIIEVFEHIDKKK